MSRFAIAFVFLCTVAGSAATQTPTPGPARDSVAAVDAIFARWARPDSPGCAVGVARRGQPILFRAYGMANLELDAPNTPETIFEAGSVSKQFTAASVVLLAARGKLSLEDPVRRYVPELPPYADSITIRQMLNHTSGLRDWGVVFGIGGWPRTTRVYTHAHVLELLTRQKSLNFPPGTEYSYSNSGYSLAAIIVERVSGMPYAEFTRRELFEPLGMTKTSWRDDFTRIVKGRSTAYDRTNDGWRQEMPFENTHGHGGLLTTVGDLLKWNENFVRPRVGDSAFVAEMQRQGLLRSGSRIRYALGLTVDSYRGTREVAHTGATAAYRAFLARYPEHGLSVAMLCNASDASTGGLGRRIADVFLPGRDTVQRLAFRDVESSPGAEAIAGLYRSTRDFTPLRVRADSGGVRLGQQSELFRAIGPAEFAGRSGARFIVQPASANQAARLMRPTEDGDTLTWVRVDAWTPTAAQLAAFAGTYRSDEAEVELRISVRGDSLVLHRRPAASMTLAPSYRDAFLAPETGLIRFHRNARGRVTGFSVGQPRVRALLFTRTAG